MPGVHNALSEARFEAYRTHPSDTDVECLKRYVWNVALCQALYSTVHYLEIALRNGIHNAATTTFGTQYWFDDPRIMSDPRTLRIISDAKGQLTRSHKPIEAARVVAGLHFGFWRQLFYDQYEQRLWRHIIKDVFPNAPKSQRQRAKIAPRIHRAKQLRNRIFHHEPVWPWEDLPAQQRRMIETIAWISHPLADLARVSDRFDQAYRMDLTPLEPSLHQIPI